MKALILLFFLCAILLIPFLLHPPKKMIFRVDEKILFEISIALFATTLILMGGEK